jgi:cysteinyl-tRNA synthetase
LHEPGGKATKKASAEGEKLRREFWAAAADDLNLPQALAVAWRVARSRFAASVKRELLMDFDRLLGLELIAAPAQASVPPEVTALAERRQELRRRKEYAEADSLRDEIRGMGFEVRDGHTGAALLPVPGWAADSGRISSSTDVSSLLDQPDEAEFTIGMVAGHGLDELRRCLDSVKHQARSVDAEIIVVDNGLDDGEGEALDQIAADDERIQVFHADHFLGAAAGRNVVLRQARGHLVVLLDTSVELNGDAFSPLRALLEDTRVGVAGRWGATTEDLRDFEEAKSSGDVDAVEGYVLAFRREIVREMGLLDEKYRFYRHLDLDFSLAIRSRGYRAVINTDVPVTRHEHVDWAQTPPEERERLSKRNFYRFLRKWGKRNDLLVAQAR